MSGNLTKSELAELVGRLCIAYGKPFGAKGEDLVSLWFDKLRWFPTSSVQTVIEKWIESEARFPNIAAVIQRVRGNLPQTDAERQPRDSADCPHCRTPFYAAPYELASQHPHPMIEPGTVVWRLRCRCPQSGNGWDTMRAVQSRVAATLP